MVYRKNVTCFHINRQIYFYVTRIIYHECDRSFVTATLENITYYSRSDIKYVYRVAFSAKMIASPYGWIAHQMHIGTSAELGLISKLIHFFGFLAQTTRGKILDFFGKT